MRLDGGAGSTNIRPHQSPRDLGRIEKGLVPKPTQTRLAGWAFLLISFIGDSSISHIGLKALVGDTKIQFHSWGACHKICKKSRFTAPVKKSELLNDHHHVQSAAPAKKKKLHFEVNSSDPLHLSRKVDFEARKHEVSLAPATKSDHHDTTTRAQGIFADPGRPG